MCYFTKKAAKEFAYFIGFIALVAALILSCTANQKAKDYGGTAKITLPDNQKLINVTWKDADLWYITRPMTQADTAIVYTFQEKSEYGIWNGSYIITEVKNMPAPDTAKLYYDLEKMTIIKK